MRIFTWLALASLLLFYPAAGQKLAGQTKRKPGRLLSATVLGGRCAVIIRPDSRKVKLLKRGITEDNYMTLVMDNEYYMGMAINFLDSVKLRQIEKKSIGILNFRSVAGKYFKVPLSSFDWGILLFNGRAKPINADITTIEEEYRAYMRK